MVVGENAVGVWMVYNETNDHCRSFLLPIATILQKKGNLRSISSLVHAAARACLRIVDIQARGRCDAGSTFK